MELNDLIKTLSFFLPRLFSPGAHFLETQDGQVVIRRLLDLENDPITITHLNQILHLSHEAGMTDGFFQYYFLSFPSSHPYPVDRLLIGHSW
jgi:hypothetical protein